MQTSKKHQPARNKASGFGKQGTNRRRSAAQWYKIANLLNDECNKLRTENAELKAKLTPIIVAEEGVVPE